MFREVNLGCMVEMEPTRAKFKRWGQHRIPELARVTLGRGSNLDLNSNTAQLSQPVSFRDLPSFIQNEQQALFTNPIEIQPARNSTSKCSQN